MKILITGGTTFVSKFTAEFFSEKNNEVYVINRNSREQVKGVHLIECDRLNLGEVLKGRHYDLIIDVTAYNEEHIKSLLDSGVEADDYIFISSSAVYPETNSQPFTEEQICGKNSVWGDYGVNKMKAEKYLLEHFPDAYILRPPYFYGIYENLYREAFPFDCAEKDRKFYIPQNGDMKLQFFNVADLCRFIEIIIEKYPKNHIFNVGNPDTVTVREWVELCYKAVGKVPEFVSTDKSIPQRDYFCFYDYEYVLDVSRQNELMPSTVPLEKGLKDEYEWYRNNRNSIYNRKPYMEFIDNKFENTECKVDINILKMNKDEQGYVIDRLVEYNLCKVPATQNELFVDLSKKIEYKGKIIAGIIARMYCWGCVYIDTLWVEEKYRNQNIGTQLLISVENEAKIKGAHLIHLDTFDFQAKEFYLKAGYDEFGKIEDCPLNHIRYFLKKFI